MEIKIKRFKKLSKGLYYGFKTLKFFLMKLYHLNTYLFNLIIKDNNIFYLETIIYTIIYLYLIFYVKNFSLLFFNGNKQNCSR